MSQRNIPPVLGPPVDPDYLERAKGTGVGGILGDTEKGQGEAFLEEVVPHWQHRVRLGWPVQKLGPGKNTALRSRTEHTLCVGSTGRRSDDMNTWQWSNPLGARESQGLESTPQSSRGTLRM